eukprot:TRINITY_DN10563_c0_g1_i2.p1 TRINITY_DN10563_c0_g1~~TRINITY_DN10563_c0_g1_i2.p1  ORF type:complete len:100 (-),score=11.66 TRINITY_DN10563_c0_g1_i2:166-465(-)
MCIRDRASAAWGPSQLGHDAPPLWGANNTLLNCRLERQLIHESREFGKADLLARVGADLLEVPDRSVQERSFEAVVHEEHLLDLLHICLLYTSPSPRDS